MIMLGIASIAIEFINSQTLPNNGTELYSHNTSENNNESSVTVADHALFLPSGNIEDIDEYEDTDESSELFETNINPIPDRTRHPVKYPIPGKLALIRIRASGFPSILKKL